MKKIVLYALLLYITNTFAQTYVLDETFGNNGTLIHNDFSFYPTDALLINNSYYFVSDDNLVKLHYNGSLAENYGTNGIVYLDNSNQDFIISGFKYIDNYFYVYGAVRDLEEGHEDAFVCRLDENGNPDPAFGTNGFAIANFDAQETINDLVMDETGNLFCIGTRYDSEIVDSIRLIYFKITALGIVNTLFDANSFKELALNAYSNGSGISNCGNGNFLLAGTDTYFDIENNTHRQRLLLSLIDTNGNLVNSFGVNGSKLIALADGATITLKNTKLKNNYLFVNYFYSWSFLTQGSGIIKYNIDNDETIFNNDTYYNTNFKISDDGLFITGSNRCEDVQDSSCPRDFKLAKFTDAGQPDIAFNNNTEYIYNFPGENYSDDLSSTLIIEEDGTILLAGHSTAVYWETFYPAGFALLRLIPAAMSAGNVMLDKNTVYPNPFTDYINITLQSEVKSIVIVDNAGRIIASPSYTTENGVTRVNMHLISQQGSYILKAATNNGTISKTIIKM